MPRPPATRTQLEQEWCERLLALQQASGISQQKMAKEMTRILGSTWRQSRVWKLLHCEMPVSLTAFDAALQSLGMTLDAFVLSGIAGVGEFLDEGERTLIYTLRRSRTTDSMCRFVNGLVTSGVNDRK
jgi:hypothetical protein